jgi:glycosyltransferase involved in cell wall biosynthesis
LQKIQPQVIYINGLFTPRFSFFPLLLKDNLSFDPKWVIAPRGMLQEGTLAVKPLKKKIYLNLMKVLNLFEGLTWHATERQEKEDLARFGIDDRAIRIASNIPAMMDPPELNLAKKKNEIRLVFLALISPVKNLDLLLTILSDVPSAYLVTLDIYGPIKDPRYWDQCAWMIESLPVHVQVNYKGQIKPEESHQVLASYHVMSLLTKGENFGHAIFEAMYAGTPVLISDKTPWLNLADSHAGWDLELSKTRRITDKILEIASWDEADYLPWRKGARNFAERFIKETDFEKQYRELFEF